MLDTFLWIMQTTAALIFISAGYLKLLYQKNELLAKGLHGLKDINASHIKFIGAAEILGAIGLLAPMLLNIYPFLTSISAFCLALVMILAILINHRNNLSIVLNLCILLMCIFIGILR